MKTFKVDELYLIYCKSGKRSDMAAQFLNKQGFDAINMEGGILDW